MDQKCNSSDIIRGIMCDVSNCTYHTADNQCGAGHIKVGKSTTECAQCNDTLCATFEAKF